MTEDQIKQARELAFSMRHSAGQWMVPGWDGHKCANLLDSLIAALATPAPAQPDPLHVANERGEGCHWKDCPHGADCVHAAPKEKP